jgi:hypothetical protein
MQASMRAATTLVPLLQASGAIGVPNVWRGDELAQADPGAGCQPSGFAELDAELPGGGWPHGQLVELLLDDPGLGELSLLTPALAAVAGTGRTCVWVLPCEATPPGLPLPYAPALVAAGIDPARSIFVRPATPRESGWALEQSLRAAHLGALLGWLPASSGADADFRSLRRLHLLAHQHRALVFVLRAGRCAQAPSPAPLRLRLAHDGERLQVTLLKRRGRPLIDPIALQVHPARWQRRAPDAVSAHQGAPATTALPSAAALQPVPPLPPATTSSRWSMRAIFSH